jgi:hypothetical protein
MTARTVAGVSRKTYEYHRVSAINAGTWRPFVPAEPVRDRIEALKAAGVGEGQIAKLSGVRAQAIAWILGRGRKPAVKVRPDTAAAILTLDPDTAARAELALTDSVGTIRRVRALCCLGWPVAVQERMAGVAASSFNRMFHRPSVTEATAQAVRELYDRLSMTPAPEGRHATAVRRLAERNGWAPPLAWDDETIDDPACLPAFGRGDNGFLRAWLANFRTIAAHGQSREEIAKRLGVQPFVVTGKLRRAFELGLIAELPECDRPRVLAPEVCGTRAAYMRHRRRGEDPCDPCSEANNAYTSAWRRGRVAGSVSGVAA